MKEETTGAEKAQENGGAVIRLTRGELSLLLDHASRDRDRPHLRGVLFDEKRRIVVSTDGHSMAIVRYPGRPGTRSWVTPREQLDRARKMMGARHVLVASPRSMLVCDEEWKRGDRPHAVLPVQEQEELFPPYHRVFACSGAVAPHVDPERMIRALRGLREAARGLGPVAIGPAGEMEPVRVYARSTNGAEYLVLLMPMLGWLLDDLDALVSSLGSGS